MPKEPRKPGNGKQHAEWTSSKNPFARETQPYSCRFQDLEQLLPTIDRMLAQGDALIIGTTRDGGAVCITMCTGDDRNKTYVHDQRELESAVDYLYGYYDGSIPQIG